MNDMPIVAKEDEYGRITPTDAKTDPLLERFPGGVNQAWDQLNHLSSDGRHFSFDGSAFRVTAPAPLGDQRELFPSNIFRWT